MNTLTRSPYQRQIDHVGNVRHGVQTGPWRVEFPAAIDTTDLDAAKKIFQGSVISLNANGKYILGCPAGSGVNRPVPFISMKNSFDPDVTTGLSDGVYSTYSAVGGIITAIPATAGYEMETTEFDDAATYHVNDGVIPGTSTKTGLVTVATAAPGGADPYIGFVSKTPYIPDEAAPKLNKQRLAFFTDFIPAIITESDISTKVTGDGVTEIVLSGTGSTVASWAVADGVLTATLS